MATNADAAERLSASLYDARGIGWPGELEWYRDLAASEACVGPDGHRVLEVGCGTGRVSIDLVAHGCRATGVDLSPAMVDVARAKTPGDNPGWHVGDMRTFELAERFGLALIPGHSFQFMLTADDQVAALRRIGDHLRPGGLLCVHIDHPDVGWLSSLPAEPGAPKRGPAIVDPASGGRYALACAWTYERATQTATAHLAWDRLGPAGEAVERLDLAPQPLHVVGRVEMEHAVARAGFAVEALHGDFAGGPFTDASPEMVWLVRRLA